ncbi:hypothetical protein P7C70_g9359, partial [Phenoliferia sp. Uapishka_3]
ALRQMRLQQNVDRLAVEYREEKVRLAESTQRERLGMGEEEVVEREGEERVGLRGTEEVEEVGKQETSMERENREARQAFECVQSFVGMDEEA